MVKIRKPFSGRQAVTFDTVGPSRCRPEFKAECDVNNVMRRFSQSGAADHLMVHQGRFGDFLDAPSFHEACNSVILAREMFLDLPAKVRKRFDNDPAAFLEFSQNSDNESELREMGLLPPVRPDLEVSPVESSSVDPQGTANEPSGDNLEPQEG